MPIALNDEPKQEWIIKLSLFLLVTLILLFIAIEPGHTGAHTQFAGDPFTFEHNTFICEIGKDTRTWLQSMQAQ